MELYSITQLLVNAYPIIPALIENLDLVRVRRRPARDVKRGLNFEFKNVYSNVYYV